MPTVQSQAPLSSEQPPNFHSPFSILLEVAHISGVIVISVMMCVNSMVVIHISEGLFIVHFLYTYTLPSKATQSQILSSHCRLPLFFSPYITSAFNCLAVPVVPLFSWLFGWFLNVMLLKHHSNQWMIAAWLHNSLKSGNLPSLKLVKLLEITDQE